MACSIRPCDGAHVRGGDHPVMGADAALDRTQRHPTGQAVGDKHAVEGIGSEAMHTALWRRPLESAPPRPPPAATACPRHLRRTPSNAAAPPERPAARRSAVWTGSSRWDRVGPSGVPWGDGLEKGGWEMAICPQLGLRLCPRLSHLSASRRPPCPMGGVPIGNAPWAAQSRRALPSPILRRASSPRGAVLCHSTPGAGARFRVGGAKVLLNFLPAGEYCRMAVYEKTTQKSR
jgi:hypothetical protein